MSLPQTNDAPFLPIRNIDPPLSDLPPATQCRPRLCNLHLDPPLIDRLPAIECRAAQMGRFKPQKLPPIPYLLSQMIQPKRPFKFPEEERSILSKSKIDNIADTEERKDEVRFPLNHSSNVL